jgi:alkanesulfonate monooxygenase SsuD/methylene tetrahydromethanopterin reductase-like flavin-dependent oxidoreductase (luciferase family)
MQFGLCIPPAAGWVLGTSRATFVADTALMLNRISGSFDSAWVPDHLDTGLRDMLECWSSLSYFAGQYPALRFGPSVVCNAFRSPALLAKMAASLHYLTNGRLIFGLGAGGSNEQEYHTYGYELPPRGVRVAQLDEAVRVIKTLWHETPATFSGRYYTIENAYCEPRHPTPPVIMIGGSRPRMMRLIARHADWWNTAWCTSEEYQDRAARLTAACIEVGRDPMTVRKTWIGLCACAATEEEAHRTLRGGWFAERPFSSLGTVGTPDQIVEQLRPFINAGMDYWIVGFPRWPDLEMLDLFIEEVIPRIKQM